MTGRHLDELQAFLDEHLPVVDSPTFVRALGEAGWVAPHWAPEHGGRGLTEAEAVEVFTVLDERELPRQPHGSGLVLAAPTILQWSDAATKRRLLPPIASGVERWCQLFSEPGAGSDLASLATTAVRDGDEWIVNGQKVWTTYGHESEMAMLLVRTDTTAPKHAGITYFGMDMRSAGVEIRPLVQMTGETEFNEVFLEDVRIPDLHRISPLGEGWAATQTTLLAERTALSGVRRKRKASDEILGGKTIEDVLEVARALGDELTGAQRDAVVQAYVANRVLELTTQRRLHGSLTKIAKARTNQALQLVAIELLGARATAWEPDDEEIPGFIRELLRTRANSIEGGTSEIQRNIVGERVLGLPREPDPYKGQAWHRPAKLPARAPIPFVAMTSTFTLYGDQTVNRLGFGAMRITGPGIWGPPRDHDEAIAVLRRSVELGVDFIDTANSYGPYVSEELIAEALHPYGEVKVATKAGLTRTGPDVWWPVGRPEYLRQELEMSLRRLDVEVLDLWQLHRIDPQVPREEQFGVLKEALDAGKVTAVGLSEVTVEEIEAARAIVPIATVQNLYNVARRSAEDVLDHCEAHGIGFIPWFPLAGGPLAAPGGVLATVAERHGVTTGAVALAWLLHRSPVMLPIPGTGSVAHLEENMAAAALQLDPAELDEISAAAS